MALLVSYNVNIITVKTSDLKHLRLAKTSQFSTMYKMGNPHISKSTDLGNAQGLDK